MNKHHKTLATACPLALLLVFLVSVFQQDRDTAGPAAKPVAKPDLADHSPMRVDVQAVTDFAEWARSDDRSRDLQRGRELAENRRLAMKELIMTDPERALAEALPWELREALPEELKTIIEEPISATGDFNVFIHCGLEAGQKSRTEHYVVLNESGRELRAYPFGRRLDITTKRGIAVHGIAIDDVMALANDPLRKISAAERQSRGLSDKVVDVGGRLYEVAEEKQDVLRRALEGDEMTLGPRHVGQYLAMRAGQLEGVTPLEPLALPADGAGPDSGLDGQPLASPYTEGAKTILYIRARFADQDPAFEPLDLATVQTRQGNIERYWQDNSYGKSTLTTTYTTTVTLTGINTPTSKADAARFSDLLAAARTAAKQANPAWDHANFDFYTVLTQGGNSGWDYAGLASLGGAGSHLNGALSSNPRTAFHEFGHNLGLRHANYWRTDSPSPIGRDSVPGGYRDDDDPVNAEFVEYGHRHSTMSAQDGSGDLNAGRGHFTTGEKVKLDWLVQGNGDWRSISSSTSTRLYRHDLRVTDLATASNGVTRAIKINRDTNDYVDPNNRRRYWLSYRTLSTDGESENWLPYGVQVDWQRNTYGADGSIQLDMTPYTRNSTNFGGSYAADNSDKEDGVILVGRTYTDRFADIHITPTAYGGTAPDQWIDVTVNIGTQATNTPPRITSFTATATQVATGTNVTFNVSATDPNGDALAYAWDYSDASRVLAALNNSSATKSWSTAGQYVVRATVSDMKGGTDTREVVVTVGNTQDVYQISGRVLHGGLPVQGARVNIGNDYQAWTEADGTYTLAGLPLGSHTVTAAALDLSLTPQFVNPVQLTSLNAYGVDFHAGEGLPGSGGLTMAVTPYEIVVPFGASVPFTARGWDGSGQSVAVSPSWSASGGLIGPDGLYQATVPGTFTITANQAGTTATATITVGPALRYWDTSSTPGLTGGNGNWSDADWSDNTNGTALSTIGDGFDALFQADVTKSSTVSISAGSSVTAGGVTVDNANIVTLRSGGLQTVTLSTPAITVKGASTLRVRADSFTLSGSPSLSIQAGSIFEYVGQNSPNVRNTTFGAVSLGTGNNIFRTTADTGGVGINLTSSSLAGDSGNSIVLARNTDTLTVNNASGNTSTFGGIISGAGKLTKNGLGSLTLSGANSFSGGVTLGNGTANTSADDTATAGSAGFVYVGHNNALGTGKATARGAQLRASTSGIVLANAIDLDGGGLRLGGANDFTLSGPVKLVGGTRTFTVAGTPTVTISGVVSDDGTPRDFVKDGTGTLVLSGANTYGGPTIMNQGTLALGNNQVLPGSTNLSLGAATLDVGTFNDTLGTLDVTAAATIKLGTGATLAFANSSAVDWTNGTLAITGTFVSGSSLRFGTGPNALTDNQLLKISANGFSGFDLNAAGYLTATAVGGGYASWASLNGATPDFGGDHDQDGVANGIECFLGGPNANTTGFTPLPGVTNSSGTLSVTWTKAADYTGTYGTHFVVESSETLTGAWTPEASPGSVSISGNNVKYTFPPGTRKFVRLRVTGP